MQKKNVKKIVIAAVLCVAVVVGICIVAFKPEEKLAVETAKASVDTIYETLDTSGSVSADKIDNFVLPSGVKVLSLNFKEGDIVEKGDVIATFDITSLNESLNDKEASYKKALSMYNETKANAAQSVSKIAQMKKEIAELEAQISQLQSADKKSNESEKASESVKVSDKLVNRFVKTAKLFGVEYSYDDAEAILIKMLSSGNSISDLSSFVDNLGTLSGFGGSFDLGALSGMSDSSELMSAEMSLVQLKAQLATLEFQSDSTYISTLKTISDKAYQSYLAAKAQVALMKDGWIAKNKGVIAQVNINEDGTSVSGAASSQMDMSAILSAVTSGGDVSSLMSSFFCGQEQTAVKVLYYPYTIDITLSKYDVLDVALNQDVVVQSANGKEINGKVSYISSVAVSSSGLNIGSIMGGNSSATSVIPAKITVDDATSNLIVGIDVPVSIVTETVENAVVVPVETICIDGEEVFVFVLEDGKAVKRDVELGISSDTHYQIISGVTVDDVLIKNTLGLEDGVSVESK
jgi:multidrug efflux pump subunit AcrA (membrane-fusion protein)